ncbi:kinase-like protein [Hypoxylon sp. EC38]|nr:kinase-like protein [Hypoxylon sp. EC38]
MAENPDDLLPKSYKEEVQLSNLQFDGYRRFGEDPKWERDAIIESRELWLGFPTPRLGQPLKFPQPRENWSPASFLLFPEGDTPSLEDGVESNDADVNTAKIRLAEAREYFTENNPRFVYKRPLGYGGLGLAVQYRYNDTRDIAIKMSLSHWESDELRMEERMTRKMKGAAHCIQVVDPPSVGVQEPEKFEPRPTSLDSSDEEDTSGDESATEAPPPRKPRRQRTDAELTAKHNSLFERSEAWKARRLARNHNRKDFMFLEFVPGGSLENLIRRMKEADPEGSIDIPNRVLWEIWLCLVRACVAMKYPPRKFHPQRPKPSAPENKQEDLIEMVPPVEKRWRAKNIIHFDIDPSNIFIGNMERPAGSAETASEKSGKRTYDVAFPDRAENEHHLVPKLKLADFGISRDIKPHKRNIYYWYRRKAGKDSFYTPEQFGAEWDAIPPDPNGDESSMNPVAGNYGSHTNIWSIALIMWVLITQLDPPKPPQPQIPPGVQIPKAKEGEEEPDIDRLILQAQPNARISYCPLLIDGDDGDLEYIDEELRRTIYECMYHNPAHRPTIEDLLTQAIQGVKKTFPNEDDERVQRFVSQFFYDADT